MKGLHTLAEIAIHLRRFRKTAIEQARLGALSYVLIGNGKKRSRRISNDPDESWGFDGV